MLRRFFSTRSTVSRPSPRRYRLAVEYLEDREVPAVVLAPLSDSQASATSVGVPTNKPVYIPVTVTNTPNGAVTTTVTSDNAGVTASVLTGGQSVRFDISGTDSNGNPFTGSITIRLFSDVAPLASQRIIDLVNSGYYNGKIFHRVSDLFAGSTTGQTNVIVQGGSPTGTGSGGSTLPDLPDEFSTQVTFDSNGLVAFANATDDNNNAQFFFTDIQQPLANQTAFLNFNHTIFGIITEGFDTLKKMQGTQLTGQTPNNPLTITGAAVFTDTENAVIKLTPNGSFTGTANISVTATDADGTPGQATEAFAANVAADGVNSRPFISGTIPDQTTTAGTPITFTVPVTDIDGDQTVIDVRDANFSGAPANFTFTVDQVNHTVTITPNAGFTGTVQFKVGVRDGTDRSQGLTGLTTATNFDTQLLTLTVNAATGTTPPTPNGPATAQGSVPGTAPVVTILNSDGSVRFSVPVFSPSFTGGVRTAIGDVTGDGIPDVVAVPQFGGGGLIWVIDTTSGAIVRHVRVFEPSFRGGLTLQVSDVNSLGYDQVLVGAGDSGGPRVSLLDLKLNKLLADFFAGDVNARNGVDVDVGEIFSGQGQLIVAGSGPGQDPLVSLFRVSDGSFFGSFLATGVTDSTTGIHVRVGASDATTGTSVLPIFVSPLNAPAGTQEKEFNPTDFVDPNGAPKPSSTPSTGGSNFDINSLLNQSNSSSS